MVTELLLRFKGWLESLKSGSDGRKEKEIQDMLSRGTGGSGSKYF